MFVVMETAAGKPKATTIPGTPSVQMAQDQVEVRDQPGFRRFSVVGHDRGGRVAHRMALDHRDSVERLAVLKFHWGHNSPGSK